MPAIPTSIIGLIVGYRGIGGTIGFCSTLLIGRLDPRIGMAIGFGLLVVSGLWLMSLDLNVGVRRAAAERGAAGRGGRASSGCR